MYESNFGLKPRMRSVTVLPKAETPVSQPRARTRVPPPQRHTHTLTQPQSQIQAQAQICIPTHTNHSLSLQLELNMYESNFGLKPRMRSVTVLQKADTSMAQPRARTRVPPLGEYV